MKFYTQFGDCELTEAVEKEDEKEKQTCLLSCSDPRGCEVIFKENDTSCETISQSC